MWDEAIVPGRWGERQLFSEADTRVLEVGVAQPIGVAQVDERRPVGYLRRVWQRSSNNCAIPCSKIEI